MTLRTRVTALLALALALAACGAGDDAASRVSYAPDERVAAPEITGESLDGDAVALGGGPAVVNFWASWCGPCVAEAPHLAAIDRVYADQGVDVVGVNVDADASSARAFERDHDIPFPSLHDPSRSVAAAFGRVGPAGLPTTVVLDDEQRVAARLLGGVTARELSGVLDQLLEGA